MMVWGHRGHRHYRFLNRYQKPPYENSLLAYQEALRGCMGVECDLIQSRDETIYLAHGTSYDGKGMPHEMKDSLDSNSKDIIGNQFVYQLSDEVVRHLHLPDHQIMPTLRELFELIGNYPNRFVNLELKGPMTAESVLKEVDHALSENKITSERIVFSSFDFQILQDIRSLRGDEFKIGCLFDVSTFPKLKMYPNWPMAPQNAYYIPFNVSWLDDYQVKEIRPDFFNLECESATTEVLDLIAEKHPQAKLIIWTADEAHPDDNELLIDTIIAAKRENMIYAVITDFPDEVQHALIKRGVSVQKP